MTCNQSLLFKLSFWLNVFPAGLLSCQVELEGNPVDTVIAIISSRASRPLGEIEVSAQGDQLDVRSPHHADLQVMLPFGVDGSTAEAQLKDTELVLRFQYAPISHLWASGYAQTGH